MENKSSKTPLILCIIICLIMLTAMCSYTVGQSQAVVLTSLGKQSVELRPGLHFKLPWPISKAEKINTKRQIFNGSARDIPTSDNILLSSQISASWRITDPLKFRNSLGTLTDAQSNLKSIIETSQETILRSKSRDQLFSTEGMTTTEKDLLEDLNDRIQNSYGISFDFVGITSFSVPAANSETILSRMKEERIKEASIIRSEAESTAQIMRNEADSKKAKILAEAEAEARRKRGTSLVTIIEQYENHLEYSDFILFLKKLDALGEVSRYDTTLFLDPKTPIYDVLQPQNNTSDKK
ncbi:hflC protein, putative [Lentisphaera araneosa HTCC2155]|uniref:HflC protein, putative n=1 Tax=Lentisphaera araneosa HTCC2155 TaxID=313628 RepID=A6DTT1_9BACT|nr:protease modulator HflC [Lentisphaera araneosa]EDM24952.1 hflC protein, putative [Lentisphaera araneosa HTCC2155]